MSEPLPFIRILQAVATHYEVDVDVLADVRGMRFRAGRYNEPRKVAMYLVRDITQASFPEIGRFFHRDHTTIIAACKAVANDLPRFEEDLKAIRAALEGAPAEGCYRCRGLLVELAVLKVEILEMRARFGGCG